MKIKITPKQARLILNDIPKNANISGTVKELNKLFGHKKMKRN
jgi:hypothetical protein